MRTGFERSPCGRSAWRRGASVAIAERLELTVEPPEADAAGDARDQEQQPAGGGGSLLLGVAIGHAVADQQEEQAEHRGERHEDEGLDAVFDFGGMSLRGLERQPDEEPSEARGGGEADQPA